MRTLSITALRGPNIWTRHPVLHAIVEIPLDPLMQRDVGRVRQCMALHLPTVLKRNICGNRFIPAEHSARALQSVYRLQIAQLLQDIVLELQAFVGHRVDFGTTRASTNPGVCTLVVQYEEELVGRACLELACDWCQAALQGQHGDIHSQLTNLRQFAEQTCYGIRTTLIAKAARARGIPVRRLDRASLIQLGHGIHQQRFRLGFTSRTSAVAESISVDKQLTKTLLTEVGIPVPQGRLAVHAEDAWTAACEFGLPVVVKPRDADYGNGVSLNLKTRKQVLSAFEKAREFGDAVIVESFAWGAHHRILVAGDRVVAAVRRTPPYVVGDGRYSIHELVEEANQDPARGEGDDVPFDRLPLDTSVLAEQGYHPDSVPSTEAVVVLERAAKGWWYAVNQDVTTAVHTSIVTHCIHAARVIGLDLAGVDIIAQSISQPLEDQGGVVLEINAEPGILQHLHPWCDHAQPIGEGIVESLFPLGHSGRIPLIAITGTDASLLTTKATVHLLRQKNRQVGMSCTEGVYLDQCRIRGPGLSDLEMARALLFHPHVAFGVLQVSPAGILRDGLGFDRCQGVVVNTSLSRGQTLRSDLDEEVALAIQVVVKSIDAGGFAVLNVDDPQSSEFAQLCAGEVIYIALESSHPRLAEHRDRGGKVVHLRGTQMVLATSQDHSQIYDCPYLVESPNDFKLAILGGVAAAWAMKVPLGHLDRGLAKFPIPWP